MTTGGFQSTWGKVYKYFPLKISFLLAVFIFELGSLICGVAPSSVVLIVGRAIAGIGAAGIGSGGFHYRRFHCQSKKATTLHRDYWHVLRDSIGSWPPCWWCIRRQSDLEVV